MDALKQPQYDRRGEDLGNVVALEHINVRVPDQRLATLFYVTGLGLTRDPYLMTGVTNMWVNAGRSQFHLPTGDPQVVRGCIGLVLPDRDALLRRLERVRRPLAGTAFDFTERGGAVEATCPWGNRVRCHAPGPDEYKAAGVDVGRAALGVAYVAFNAPPGSAEGIVRFYREALGAPARRGVWNGVPAARVPAGYGQELIFAETGAAPRDYDGHHIQIYVANFSGPHEWLAARGLVSEESDRYQYRFLDIVDPDTGAALFRVEHEVRSMTHPLFARPLLNRNPDQTNAAFAPGHETRAWARAEPF